MRLGEAEDAVVSLDEALPSVAFPAAAAAVAAENRASLANLVALLLSSAAPNSTIALCVSAVSINLLE
jgi:hypothetical protein